MKGRRQTEPLWNRSYLMLMGLYFMTNLVTQMVTPIITKFALTTGVELTQAATIASILAMSALVCRPFAGMLSDAVNRKWLMVGATTMVAVALYGYSISTTPAMLVAFRILHGVGFSFMGVANMAFASNFIPKSRLGEGMGYLGVGTVLASAIGPNIGLMLSDYTSYQVVFWLATGVSVASAILVLLIPYHYTGKPAIERKHFDISTMIGKEIILYAVLMGLFSCGNALMGTYISLLGEERHIANIGLYFTAYSVVVFCVRPFAGKVLDRRGLAIILYPSYIIGALGMVIVGAANALWLMIAAGICKGLSQGGAVPSIQATCVKILGKDRAGVASSTCLIGQDIGNAIAPILGSFVIEKFGYQAMYNGYALVLVCFGVMLFSVQKAIERKYEIVI